MQARLAVLALVLAACAHAPPPVMSAPDLADARAASAAFDRAQLAGDGPAIAALLAADFVFVQSDGRVVDGAAFVAGFAQPGLTFEPDARITNLTVRALGRDAVAIGGDAEIRGADHGVAFASRIRYLDVLVRTPAGWRVAYVQVTRRP